MKTFFLLLLFFPLIVLAQDENDKSTKGAWAIHSGAGIMYGGNIGLLIENQIPLNERLRISPFGSFGFAEGGTDSTSKKYYWFGYAVGANFEYGKRHRLILGHHFIGNNLIGNSFEVKKKSLVGSSFIVGYKGTAKFGLIWQLYIGDVYFPDPLSESKKYFHSSHVGIGFGYKF